MVSAVATSPLRILTPRNHGEAAWVYLSGLGGGLVGGDHFDIAVDAEAGASAFLTTQSSTKIYGSPEGSSQRLRGCVADDACLAIVPDPVVCFAGARYRQTVDVDLAPRGSLVLFDAYTCGRSARGERWRFDSYSSKSTVLRHGRRVILDSVRLDSHPGAIAERMGAFEAFLTLVALGERFRSVREAILSVASPGVSAAAAGRAIVAASPVGEGGAVLRVAATCFESAARIFRSSFAALAEALGDDPFARKW